jgi:ligand-binding sensor domain-containing protein
MIGYRNIYRYINENIVDETKQFNIPPNTYLYDIDFDNNGTMWLATNKGLGMFKNDSLIIFSESDGLVKPTSTSKVTIGKNGEVLYSTYGSGFSVYKNGSFTNFDETNGLTLNLISDIAVDSENNYWIATDGTGLQKYDGNKFINYTVRDGLSSDETYSLFIDDFENIWVGTFGGGVCYFNGEIWNNFDARDGLLQNTIKAVYGINGNKFWFGGKNGLTTYTPSKQLPELSIKKIETTFNNYNSFEELVKKKEKILVGTKTIFF